MNENETPSIYREIVKIRKGVGWLMLFALIDLLVRIFK